MTTVRIWYTYNCATGGQHNASNYYYVQDFPNSCVSCASNICAVLGIYSVIIMGATVTYGTHPRPLSADPKLDSYITQAFATGCSSPSGFGQRRYVYMKDC